MALFAVLATSEGGVREIDFYPAALFVIALLAVVVICSGRALALLPRSARIALALFAAFVLFSYLSICWADDRGVAWDAANMTLLYFATFALFAVWRWSARAGMFVLVFFGAMLALIGWSRCTRPPAPPTRPRTSSSSACPSPSATPTATPRCFSRPRGRSCCWPRDARLPWAARGLALGAGGALVDLTLLSQSRGSLLAGAIIVAACIALVPQRVRTLVAFATVGGVTALSVPELVDVFTVAGADGDVGGALSSAGDAIVLSFVALFGFGASAGLVERYANVPERLAKGLTYAVATAAIVLGIAGAVAVEAQIGNPISYAQDRWEAFKDSEPLTPETKGVRLTASLDGRSRDEFWSVALDEFRERPVGGMGAGNFAVAYARERKGREEPNDPHSLPVRIIASTGVIGAALFLGFLLAAALSVLRVRRSPNPLRRGVAAAALMAFLYWFVHASADWLFAIPAVTGPAFAWLGMAVALAAAPHSVRGVALAAELPGDDEEPEPPPPRAPRLPRRVAAGLVCACALVMAGAMVGPWLSASAVDEAATVWRSDPKDAYDLLARARTLNALSDGPDLIAGVIASRLEDRVRARRSFARAVQRSPLGWYGHQQLGIEEALAGNHRSALWQLERSLELNPREETTQFALNEVRANRAPAPERVRAVLINRVCSRVPTARVC